MPTKDDPRITVRLDPALHELLTKAAEQHGVPLSSHCRDLLKGGIHPELQKFHLCPAHGCTYASSSPAAVCSVHGRTVR